VPHFLEGDVSHASNTSVQGGAALGSPWVSFPIPGRRRVHSTRYLCATRRNLVAASLAGNTYALGASCC
jgi:hypothetical protein